MPKNDRLRQAREAMGITQREMAARLSISPPSYNHIEKSETAAFSDSLMSLITELGISLDWIITGRGEMLLPQTPTPTTPDEPEPEALMEEMEERVRRIKIDVSDIEDTLKKMLGRRRK
jgi:transcriptional regulator with XRE-family HTH domain